MLADTPRPPYTAVIFTSVRAEVSLSGEQAAAYARTAQQMERLAAAQPGYLGIESARESPTSEAAVPVLGITVSYWVDAAAARAWKQVAEHLLAQRLGRESWYSGYRVRIATVERDYGT